MRQHHLSVFASASAPTRDAGPGGAKAIRRPCGYRWQKRCNYRMRRLCTPAMDQQPALEKSGGLIRFWGKGVPTRIRSVAVQFNPFALRIILGGIPCGD
jgi:hypothetical protein